jgi:hypothetical protein
MEIKFVGTPENCVKECEEFVATYKEKFASNVQVTAENPLQLLKPEDLRGQGSRISVLDRIEELLPDPTERHYLIYWKEYNSKISPPKYIIGAVKRWRGDYTPHRRFRDGIWNLFKGLETRWSVRQLEITKEK